jgi:putative membrane protein insertion efficiency factor
MIGRLLWPLRFLAETLLIALVRFYQVVIRPLLPPLCRFHPSCSEYFILAVRKYGPLRGACKGTWRICRCNPWTPGGYDPP